MQIPNKLDNKNVGFFLCQVDLVHLNSVIVKVVERLVISHSIHKFDYLSDEKIDR